MTVTREVEVEIQRLARAEGWAVGTIANRVIIVWLYNNTGKSLFAAAVYHATINLGWQLFPNFGSHYDPRVASLIVACVAVIVVIVWGPRTFTRF